MKSVFHPRLSLFPCWIMKLTQTLYNYTFFCADCSFSDMLLLFFFDENEPEKLNLKINEECTRKSGSRGSLIQEVSYLF